MLFLPWFQSESRLSTGSTLPFFFFLSLTLFVAAHFANATIAIITIIAMTAIKAKTIPIQSDPIEKSFQIPEFLLPPPPSTVELFTDTTGVEVVDVEVVVELAVVGNTGGVGGAV